MCLSVCRSARWPRVQQRWQECGPERDECARPSRARRQCVGALAGRCYAAREHTRALVTEAMIANNDLHRPRTYTRFLLYCIGIPRATFRAYDMARDGGPGDRAFGEKTDARQ